MPLAATAASQSLPRMALTRTLRTVGLVMQCTVTAREAHQARMRPARVAGGEHKRQSSLRRQPHQASSGQHPGLPA